MSERIYYSQEARQTALRRQLFGAFAMLGIGFGIGAVLTLLFAPDEGEKTREQIADALEEGFQRGRAATEDAIGQLESESPDIYRKIRQKMDQVIASN